MGAQEIQGLRSEIDAFLSLKTDCNSRRFRQIQQRVCHPKKKQKKRKDNKRDPTTNPNVETIGNKE